jgi:two-component system nitrogen regulation response regulator GlnG
MRGRILVVDDDEASCRLIRATFEAEGLDVVAAADGRTGLEMASTGHPDAVLLDLNLPGLGGLEVLERLKSLVPQLPIVMLTASRNIKDAVRATQLGAFDYLTKPIDHDEILLTVQRALQVHALQCEVEDLRKRVGASEAVSLAQAMGPGAEVRHVIEQVGIVAASNFTVLLLGETGTGKELVARAIHNGSERRRKPFVALDCGAIPDALLESELFGYERGAFSGADRRKQGQFQMADGGTCFLDEVGNLPPALQMKLLRVLESRQVQPVGAERASPVDIRFVAATNADLQSTVSAGHFRADLYFRLAQYTITLPPLRQRRGDIPYLSQRFVEEASVELRRPVLEIAPAAIALLQDYPWPGNVRELRNVVRQLVLQAPDLSIGAPAVARLLGHGTEPQAAATASSSREGMSLREVAESAARTAEREAIAETLRATGGNKSQAAKRLKTDYKTLHTKMRTLGLEGRDFR